MLYRRKCVIRSSFNTQIQAMPLTVIGAKTGL